MRVRAMRWWLIIIVTVVVTGNVLPRVGLSGRTRQRVPSRCALPSCYHYDRIRPRPNEASRRVAKSIGSAPAIERTPTVKEGQCVCARRDFPFENRSVAVGNFKLEQIGVSLYETGEIIATGTISNTAEPPADGMPRNVSVRLQAFGRTAGDKKSPDGPLHWQSIAAYKLGPGQSAAVKLCRTVCSSAVCRHFNEIHFVRVQLEYRKPQ